MRQSISGHVGRLLPAHSGVILLLENAQEIAISGDCMPTDLLELLQLGNRVWYFPEPVKGRIPDTAVGSFLYPPDM